MLQLWQDRPHGEGLHKPQSEDEELQSVRRKRTLGEGLQEIQRGDLAEGGEPEAEVLGEAGILEWGTFLIDEIGRREKKEHPINQNPSKKQIRKKLQKNTQIG